MAQKRFKPKRRPPSFRPKRTDVRRALWLIPMLLIGGALFDPSLIPPVGPLAAAPERVSSRFTPCGTCERKSGGMTTSLYPCDFAYSSSK